LFPDTAVNTPAQANLQRAPAARILSKSRGKSRGKSRDLPHDKKPPKWEQKISAENDVTRTFASKDKKPLKTRAVKKDWKKVFELARKLKESPIIPNNYYQSDYDDDDDDSSWDGWSYDDSSHISDEYYMNYACVCIVNEGHKDRNDPNMFQQQFYQRKQTRKACIKWNRMVSLGLCYGKYNYDIEYILDDCSSISDDDHDWDDVHYRKYYPESYPDSYNNYPDHNFYWESQW
jgi:hypothetical protein